MEKKLVNVLRPFSLNLKRGGGLEKVQVAAGVQYLEPAVADHWFVAAHLGDMPVDTSVEDAKRAAELDRREAELVARADDLAKVAAELVDREAALLVRERDLATERQQLEADRQQLDARIAAETQSSGNRKGK